MSFYAKKRQWEPCSISIAGEKDNGWYAAVFPSQRASLPLEYCISEEHPCAVRGKTDDPGHEQRAFELGRHQSRIAVPLQGRQSMKN